MERPLRPVVLVQVHSVLLAQAAHLLVELPGDVDVSGRDRPGNAFGAKEPVDLWGGGEDAVVGSGTEHLTHVRLGQVEVARRQKHGRVWAGVGQQALGEQRRTDVKT